MKTSFAKNLSILICSARRPDYLQDLLRSIVAAQTENRTFHLEIVLVDNDPLQSAEPVALAFKSSEPLPLTYLHEPDVNISTARNRAVDAARYDLCLFLDDDQLVPDDFFDQLQQTISDAPVDFGAIRLGIKWKFEVKVPAWLEQGITGGRPGQLVNKKGDRHLVPLDRTEMGTGGLLFDKTRLAPVRPLFDERLGKSGGEDIDLYLRSSRKALPFLMAARPSVSERVPAARATFRYGLTTAFRKGFVDTRLHVRNGEIIYKAGQAAKASVFLVLSIATWPVLTVLKPDRWYQHLLLVWRQLGKFKALFRQDHNHYVRKDRAVKILHLTGGGQDGGAEKVIEQISSHVSKTRSVRTKLQLCFFFYDTAGKRNFSQIIMENGYQAVFHKKTSSLDWRLWLRLIAFVRSEQVTIIHTHDIGAMLHARIAKLFLPSIRLIHTEHTLHYWINSKKYRMLYRYLSRSFSYVAGVSTYVKSELETKVKVAPCIIRVVPNGVDVSHFAGSLQVDNQLSSDDFKLVAISRIDPNKNLQRVIRGIALARERGIPVSFVHVGTGLPEDITAIERLVEELGLSESVNLFGYSTNVAPHLAAADCFVSASKVECHPVSVLEAMASGKPCVLSNIAPHIELLQCGIVLFDDNDAELADAIETMYLQRKSYPQFAYSLSKSASNVFSMPVMMARYNSLYGSI